jgi:hypothetical protein
MALVPAAALEKGKGLASSSPVARQLMTRPMMILARQVEHARRGGFGPSESANPHGRRYRAAERVYLGWLFAQGPDAIGGWQAQGLSKVFN